MKYLFTSLIIGAFGVVSASAQTPRPIIDLATAALIRDHCLKSGAEAGHAMAIAVFDTGGELITYAKADGASTATGAVAQWKGKSAAVYRFSTEETGGWGVPTAPMIATVRGGFPVFTKTGEIIGGVGVSGAPSTFDAACASDAVKAAGLLTAAP